jgi:hypothetical protein
MRHKASFRGFTRNCGAYFPQSRTIIYQTSSCDCCSVNAMAIQKKHGKGRLDKWYKLAKEKGICLAQTCVDNTDSQSRLQSAGGV